MLNVLQRIATILVAGVVAAYALLLVHDFGVYAGHYPYMSVDDGLANISYVWGTLGRYGFMSSPTLLGMSRLDGQFNYGPWYFAIGAALVWLFGYSLAMLRAIHLIGILWTAVAAAGWIGRRTGTAAAGAFSLAVLYTFDSLQWPMVRPDIAVSAFAVGFVWAAGRAIEQGRWRDWFLAGLCAGSASLSHLIAWALVPAAALVFALGYLASARAAGKPTWNARLRAAVPEGLAIAGGGLAAALMFYGSFGFRFADQWQFLGGYRAFTSGMMSQTAEDSAFMTLLGRHVNLAFGTMPDTLRLGVWIGLALAVLLLVLSARASAASRTRIVALLLPPVVAWLAYMVSLGAYQNFHLGYAMLNQTLGLWCAASVLGVLIAAPAWAGWHRSSRMISIAGAVAVIGAGSALVADKAVTPGFKRDIAERWVSIAAYTDEVLRPLPAGAFAWGSVLWGVENPGRVQLVQWADAISLIERLPPSDRAALAPDYLVWGYPENRDNLVSVLRGQRDLLARLALNFPASRYELVSLVAGAPYGPTRIYRRRSLTEPDDAPLPLVSIFEPSRGQWSRQLGGALPLSFTASAPATVRIGYQESPPPVSVSSTLTADLPQGDYLLRVSMQALGSPAHGVVLVTTSPDYSQTMSELGPDFDSTSYGGDDRATYVLHRHPGGAFYVSHLAAHGTATITGIEVWPIEHLPDYTDVRQRRAFQPLPPVEQWNPDTPGGVRVESAPEGRVVQGNGTQWGYQVVSPPLPVTPGSRIVIRPELVVHEGRVCVGVLNETTQLWLVPPDARRPEYQFDAGANTAIHLVVANCYPQTADNPLSRFEVLGGSYASIVDQYYADLLVQPLLSTPAVQP